jgi:hypothetical protein
VLAYEPDRLLLLLLLYAIGRAAQARLRKLLHQQLHVNPVLPNHLCTPLLCAVVFSSAPLFATHFYAVFTSPTAREEDRTNDRTNDRFFKLSRQVDISA